MNCPFHLLIKLLRNETKYIYLLQRVQEIVQLEQVPKPSHPKYTNIEYPIENDSYTHMSFISPLGFKVSRAITYFGVLSGAFAIYLTPDYFHELVINEF